MAVIVSKTNLISSWHHDQRLQHHGLSKCHRSRVSFASARLPLVKLKSQPFRSFSFLSHSQGNEFYGKRLSIHQNRTRRWRSFVHSVIVAQLTLANGNSQKWWQKGIQPNMREVTSAQDLVESLKNAGDKLVVVDFFSPGCGGCKALHPKICQLAETNPEIQFLHVNYEKHKSMCYALGVHVLPYFRFYRGAHGRLCSFSCTNATIKKFRDALAKHSPDRCSIGPTKGLDEKELLALSANSDVGFKYTAQPVEPAKEEQSEREEAPPAPSAEPIPLPASAMSVQISSDSNQERTLVSSGR